ncbi:mobilization protein [Aeromonas caviae]|uniref:mobilization protein n=1 Tax=Aeromonas caviae TaxID=648 RepID=UPI000FEBB444|nr:mobilization protein [Aeromonas caviae]RWT33078.1 mobilization protein [Aeromonas caviae]
MTNQSGSDDKAKKKSDKLAALERRRAEINAEILKVKAATQKKARADDTRRKVLLGAMVMAWVESGKWTEDKMRSSLDQYLERDNDRALFELPPKPKASTDGQQ